MPLPDLARDFWCAAYFYRRAPDRNPTTAIRILRHIAANETGPVQSRADTLLKEIEKWPRRSQL